MPSFGVCFWHDDHNKEHDTFAEFTDKDLSLQDVVCLSEELKTNTITTSLNMGSLELMTLHEMKMKRDFQCYSALRNLSHFFAI